MLETEKNLNDDGQNIGNNYNNKQNIIRFRFPKFMKVRQFFVIVTTHFVTTVAFCYKTLEFCKKSYVFFNKLLSHFVIK